VPPPFDFVGSADTNPPAHFVAHDLRRSTAHPLRHAVLNVIRQVGESRILSALGGTLDHATGSEARSQAPGPIPTYRAEDSLRNGQNYLLTSLSLFTTHEPCIMCSMALLHSRVKEIFYIFPMALTGGCGGSVCVPRLPSVNHRFMIGRWKDDRGLEGLQIEEDSDA